MKVFIQEIKKILRPLPLLLLTVFTILFVFVFMKESYFNMKYMHDVCDNILVGADLIKLCGLTLEPEEIEPAYKALSEKYTKEIEEYIKTVPLLAEAGVTDYESYFALQGKIVYSHFTPEKPDVEYQINDFPPYDSEKDYTLTSAEQKIEEQGLLSMTAPALPVLDYTIQNYENIQVFKEASKVNSADLPLQAQARIREFYENGETRNILPGRGMEYFRKVFPLLSIMIVAALIILFSPIITRENMNGVVSLQYSSKIGRKITGIQLAAMLTIALIISIIEIIAVMGFFIKTVWKPFLGTGLNGFNTPFEYNWFRGSFGQYLICIAALIITVSFAATMLIFISSKLSKNYISLLLSIVPLGGILIYLCYLLFRNTFEIRGMEQFSFYKLIHIPYAEVLICGVLILISVVVSILLLKNQRKKEIF